MMGRTRIGKKLCGRCLASAKAMEMTEGDRRSASRWPSEQRCVHQSKSPIRTAWQQRKGVT